MLVYRKREAERSYFARAGGHAAAFARAPCAARRIFRGRGAGLSFPGRRNTARYPLLLSDMEKAVSRLRAALAKGERVCVYGDYDVDGVTAAAILSLHLKSLGADVRTYLPDRHREG